MSILLVLVLALESHCKGSNTPSVKPRLHDATCCQPVKCLYTRCNRLSNRFDNRLDVCLHDTASCQTGLTTGCIV